MKKEIKIEIKNRWTGNILFEYSKENNTVLETLLEAIKGDADLRGADLRGADLRGAIIDYNDNNNYGDTTELLDNLKENSNIIPTVVYENHDATSSRYGCFWKNLIIIREWEIKEDNAPEIKEMAVAEISKQLGYEVKIVK